MFKYISAIPDTNGFFIEPYLRYLDCCMVGHRLEIGFDTCFVYPINICIFGGAEVPNIIEKDRALVVVIKYFSAFTTQTIKFSETVFRVRPWDTMHNINQGRLV